MARLGTPLFALYAVIALLIAADAGIVVLRLTSVHPTGPPPTASQPAPDQSGHPCNHGQAVSRAAHQHKGGQNVSGVARSGQGKNKSCPAPG